MDRDTRLRWPLVVALGLVPIVLVVAGGHRGTHAARNLLVPGSGMFETLPLVAIACFLAVIASIVAWLRWGTDWIVAAVLVATMTASALWGTGEHEAAVAGTTIAVPAAHEFPIVVLIIGFLAWIRSALGGVPGFGWVRGRRARNETTQTLADLGPVDRCRAVSVLALAGHSDPALRDAVVAPDVERRAHRISLVARFRTGDPFDRDHAGARTALALVGERPAMDAVAPSEPGFVRLLDGTLAAAAIDDATWSTMLRGPFALRRGHRNAWWWTPIGVPGGRALDWEHAAATAIAHHRGWIDDADWAVLRRRVLGAAARGVERRDDERLIAAGRLWLAVVDDPAADRIVERPTVRHDPLARALDALAEHLHHERLVRGAA
jgi:hypothetical protein